MPTMQAIALKTNEPQLIRPVLNQIKNLQFPKLIDGYGVANCIENEVFLSKIPGPRENLPIDFWADSAKSNCILAQVRTPQELRPQKVYNPDDILAPFRLHGCAASILGGPQQADAAFANREKLITDLPDFLAGQVKESSEAEGLFLSIIHEMHKRSLLDRFHTAAHQVMDCIHAVLEKIDNGNSRVIFFAFRQEIIVVSNNKPCAVLLAKGFAPEEKQALRHDLLPHADHFKAAFAFAWLSNTKIEETSNEYQSWKVFPKKANFVLNQDLGLTAI